MAKDFDDSAIFIFDTFHSNRTQVSDLPKVLKLGATWLTYTKNANIRSRRRRRHQLMVIHKSEGRRRDRADSGSSFL